MAILHSETNILRNIIGTDGDTTNDDNEGNVISGNNGAGIYITSTSVSNTIAGNIVGLDATGTLDKGNSGGGELFIASANNTIGGNTADERNVISGNSQSGIVISQVTATGNQVLGNYIGTDATGLLDRGKSSFGIYINSGISGNIIGGLTAASANIISGNGSSGVFILQSSNNEVLGNYLGTNVTGTAGLANHSGITIGTSSADNKIGGVLSGAGNLIAFNNEEGMHICVQRRNRKLGPWKFDLFEFQNRD